MGGNGMGKEVCKKIITTISILIVQKIKEDVKFLMF